MTTPALLEVRDLFVRYPDRRVHGRGRFVEAVAGVSFDLAAGEVLGLVGESGSGKSSLARSVLRLQPASDGSVVFAGQDLATLSPRALRALRADLQIVFQDPSSCLDPRRRVGASIAEPLTAQGWSRPDAASRVAELLDLVGLAANMAAQPPHELSGGMRQRVGIARALATSPRLVVLDEPVSALDVSIQAGILNLLTELQASTGVAFLLISHDLSVVRHLADRVAVMYLGTFVEVGPASEVLGHPRHPYTHALRSAVPVPDPAVERARRREVLEGDPPDPAAPPSGCRFRTRCPFAQERCAAEVPALVDRGHGHPVACHFPEVLDG